MRCFLLLAFALSAAACDNSVKVTIKVKNADAAVAEGATLTTVANKEGDAKDGDKSKEACCQAETATKAVP